MSSSCHCIKVELSVPTSTMPEMVEDQFADVYKWKNICHYLDIYPKRPKRNQTRNDNEDDYKVVLLSSIMISYTLSNRFLTTEKLS